MNTPLNSAPYLREQRHFPTGDIKNLSAQMDHAYIDIASKVNARSIGIFSLNFPAITGDAWYFTGQPNKQQSLRQIYTFTGAGPIPHGINYAEVFQISPQSYGTYTDTAVGTNWYGVIYASSVAIAGQVSFYVTPTDIVVLLGGGAPPIHHGSIILTWVSKF